LFNSSSYRRDGRLGATAHAGWTCSNLRETSAAYDIGGDGCEKVNPRCFVEVIHLTVLCDRAADHGVALLSTLRTLAGRPWQPATTHDLRESHVH